MEENDSSIGTIQHQNRVIELMELISEQLKHKAEIHDNSKLGPYEKPYFDNAIKTHALAGLTYGSEEYKKSMMDTLKPALDHHYKVNSHHPEHYENGVDDMNLLDVVEMFVDWKAATERHADGDINKSININEERFNISPQLANIFRNTIKYLNW